MKKHILLLLTLTSKIIITAYKIPERRLSVNHYIKKFGMPIPDAEGMVNLSGKGITDLHGINRLKRVLNLINLDLSNNKITSIPSEAFFGFKALEGIDLSKNRIDEIHINALDGVPTLEQLRLSHNYIAKFPPRLFENLPNLQGLYFDYNNFETIPKNSLKPLKKLSFIRIYNNKLKGDPLSFKKQQGLSPQVAIKWVPQLGHPKKK